MAVPWKRFRVDLKIKNRVVGGIPTNKELIAGWVGANMPEVQAAEKEALVKKTLADLPEAAEEKAEKMWTTFKVDAEGRPYLEGRCLKSMFKEAANVLRDSLIKQDLAEQRAKYKAADGKKTDKPPTFKSALTNLKSKVAEQLTVEEDIVHFLRNGQPVAKIDGSEERAIHVMTAQGPRNALKKVDYVAAPATLRFHVRILDGGVCDEQLIKDFLEYAGWFGCGSDRSQGNGLFETEAVIEQREARK